LIARHGSGAPGSAPRNLVVTATVNIPSAINVSFVDGHAQAVSSMTCGNFIGMGTAFPKAILEIEKQPFVRALGSLMVQKALRSSGFGILSLSGRAISNRVYDKSSLSSVSKSKMAVSGGHGCFICGS